MRTLVPLVLLVLIAGCQSSATQSASSTGEVRIAAAADLRFALEELTQEYQRRNPVAKISVTYGSSGNFFAQLQGDAPFDMFLSADVDYPRRLVESGYAERDSEFIYAIGHLVVWTPRSSPLDVEKLGVKALLEPGVRKIAIANPKHAPYGRAAEAALKNLGMSDTVRGKLVYGDNVAQTAQFVQSGAADVGIIAQSLALSPTMRDAGKSAEVPEDAYPRMDQAGVILAKAKDRAAAKAFREFLQSADGKAVLRRYGFGVPGEE